MDSSIWFDAINLGWVTVYILRGHRDDFLFPTKTEFLSLKIILVLAKTVDPDECGISSGSSLFVKVYMFPVYIGLTHLLKI